MQLAQLNRTPNIRSATFISPGNVAVLDAECNLNLQPSIDKKVGESEVGAASVFGVVSQKVVPILRIHWIRNRDASSTTFTLFLSQIYNTYMRINIFVNNVLVTISNYSCCRVSSFDKTVVRSILSIYYTVMDFVSHTLWGGVSFGRKNTKTFLLAGSISILPDILTEGLFMVLYLLNIGGMPGWEHGHPNISDYPKFAQNLYNVTHSLVVFAIVFILFWVAARKPIWIVAAWGLHILIDIPTHSLALFPTPFLWPISNIRVNGIGWDNPIILTVDIILLMVAYLFWFYRKVHRAKSCAN
jgi:hypothetical protein